VPISADDLVALYLTRSSLAARTPDERAVFARALAAKGFNVVDHDPYKGMLEVFLTHEGENLVATLRSDGWFVDEAVGKDVDTLAAILVVSQRLTDFIRNSGLPQQRMIPEN
jgi:hypothetical protein